MSDDLEERIRSHSYVSNPAVSQYLDNQSDSSQDPDVILEQTTVRERHPSNMSAASDDQLSYEESSAVSHVRCLTPLNDSFTEYDCAICKAPAINPFRCTTINERTTPGIVDDKVVQHLCCYQCLTNYMQIYRTDCFPCPLCKQNEFNLNNLIHANDRIVREAEMFVAYCRFNCGLLGSPLALANHICPLQDHKLSGHILESNIVQNSKAEISRLTDKMWKISDESSKLKEELSHVLRNYNLKKDNLRKCHSEYEDLLKKYKESEALNSKAFLEMDTRLEIHENTNKRLRHQIEGKDEMICRMAAEKKEIEKECKSKLKIVAKHYKTKNQELTERNDRLTKELNDLIAVSTGAPGADTQPSVRNDWSQTDEQSLDIRPLFANDNPSDSNCISAQESESSSDEEVRPQHL